MDKDLRKYVEAELKRVEAVRDLFEPGSYAWIVNNSMAIAYQNVLSH